MKGSSYHDADSKQTLRPRLDDRSDKGQEERGYWQADSASHRSVTSVRFEHRLGELSGPIAPNVPTPL